MAKQHLFVGVILLVVGAGALGYLMRGEEGGDDGVALKKPETLTPEETRKLQAKVRSLEKELAVEKTRADRAEARLEELKPRIARLEGAKPAEKTVSAGEGGDDAAGWKQRRDEKFSKLVDAVDWKKYMPVMVDYFKELEAARKEGRAPKLTPEMINGLTEVNTRVMACAKERGVGLTEVYENELVGERFTEALVEALAGGPLNDDQWAMLKETTIFSGESPARKTPMGQWSDVLRLNLALLTETKGVLTEAQYAGLSETVTPGFLQMQVPKSDVVRPAETTGYWMRSLELPQGSETIVQAIADDYARGYRTVAEEYARHGTPLPKEKEIELLIRLADLQMAAEARLAETLPLTAEQKARVLQGSGGLLKLKLE